MLALTDLAEDAGALALLFEAAHGAFEGLAFFDSYTWQIGHLPPWGLRTVRSLRAVGFGQDSLNLAFGLAVCETGSRGS